MRNWDCRESKLSARNGSSENFRWILVMACEYAVLGLERMAQWKPFLRELKKQRARRGRENER